MAERISDLTLEQLGSDATEATLEQFKRACEAAIREHHGILIDIDERTGEPTDANLEANAISYVWNDGDFGESVRELLGEEIAA